MTSQRRPNFFIVGAPKSGTTSMCAYLAQHPQVYLSPIKEPRFFGRDLEGHRDAPTLEAYEQLFAGAAEPILMEGTTWYMMSRQAAGEIHAYNPDAKVCMMLRSPLQVVPSLHNQQLADLVEDEPDLAKALDLQGARREGRSIPRGCRYPFALQYEQAATLTPQVARYLDVFGADRVKVLLFDDFAADPLASYRQLLSFLGVDEHHQPDMAVHNPRKRLRSRLVKRLVHHPGVHRLARLIAPAHTRARIADRILELNTAPEQPQRVPDALKRRLARRFEQDVHDLGRLLGRDLSHWLET